MVWIDYTDKTTMAFYSQYSRQSGWITVSLGENSRAYYPCGVTVDRRDSSVVYLSEFGIDNTESNIVKLSIDVDDQSTTRMSTVPNDNNLFYCRPMALEPNAHFDLVFTSIHKHDSFMKFDTSLYAFKFQEKQPELRVNKH